MMGMMTLVRVLSDKEYDEIMARIKSGTKNPPLKMDMKHIDHQEGR
jgi:hypothetical protein